MLDVGGVVARLGAKLDDDGFDRFERRLRDARQTAERGAEAELRADVDDRGFRRYNDRLDDTEKRTSRMAAGVSKSFGGLRFAVFGAATAAGAAVGVLGKKVVDTASDINESLSKNTVLFGKYADGVAKFADSSAKSFGISKAAALEATGTFGNLFVALDIGPKKAADMSVELTKLAADLASFNNASPEEALEAIRSGLVGETEPLRRFGVNLNDAALRAEALRLGLVKSTKEALDPQTKALAVNELLFQQTSKAQGDFERTSGGLANQQRILKARLSDLGAEIGGKLLGAVNRGAKGLNDLLDAFESGGRPGGPIDRVKRAFGGVRDVVGSVLGFVGRVIDENRDTLDSMADSGRGLLNNLRRTFNGIRDAFSDTFGGKSGTTRDVRTFIRALLDIVDAVLKVLNEVARRALPGIITAFRGFFTIIRGVIRLITGVLTGDFGKAWDGIKDIFSGGIKLVGGVLRAATAPFRSAAAAIGRAISGAFSSAWDAVVGTARGFVNRIIDVINIIPGVNIKHVGGGKGADQPGRRGSNTQGANESAGTGRQYARGGFFGATGGYMDAPVAIGGEEAPDHPEWVVPTNPAYRGRAVALWAAAARDLGIPGFAEGGLVGFAKSLPGRALNSVRGLASNLVERLPGNPGGILAGAFDWALDKAGDWIGDRAGALFRRVTGALGAGGRGSGGGKAPSGSRDTAAIWDFLAGRFGLRKTSGYRDPGHNAAVGGVPGSLHTHGTPARPGAIDLVGSLSAMREASAYARRYGPVENMIHDVGSGLHLHLGFFRRGGKNTKRPPRPRLNAKENRGIRRSVARGETGIRSYERDIQDLERNYDQANRSYDLDPNDFLVEHDDGSVTIDETIFRDRVGELESLQRKRDAIKRKIEAYRTAVRKAIQAYTAALATLKKALAAAKGKSRKKERAGYRERIADYTSRRGELRRVADDLGFDIRDSELDAVELGNELAAIRGPGGVAIGARPAPAADTDTGGDTATSDGGAPATIDPAEVAAQAIAQVGAFQAARADLFGRYGANFVRAGDSPFAGVGAQAAGTRYFGGSTGGADAGVIAGAGGSSSPSSPGVVEVTQHITFTGPQPAEPHTFTQAALHELKAAV